ncbi:MAG TPA: hypothetical protein VF941_02900 [Clostridia bacterium]
MAAPQKDETIEYGMGGLPLVRDQGLNTNQPVNFSGATVDTSGNVALPGTLAVTGVATFTAAPAFTAAPTGQFKVPVISGSGATVTLTAAQSGSTALFDRAAGIVYTLPAPVVGLYFDFIITTTITSNAAKVITDAGTTLLQGTLVGGVSTTATPFYGNASTHISVSMNGTTTGGIFGTKFRLTCVSATLWDVQGLFQASGTIATPFATS